MKKELLPEFAIRTASSTINSAPIYVQKLDLTRRCSQSPVDLSRVFADTDSLQQMANGLVAPFGSSHIDYIIAMHIVTGDKQSAKRSEEWTGTIAGAVAGVHRLGTSNPGCLVVNID